MTGKSPVKFNWPSDQASSNFPLSVAELKRPGGYGKNFWMTTLDLKSGSKPLRGQLLSQAPLGYFTLLLRKN